MGLAFFGLTSETAPQIRLSIFKQIHEIVFHGKGGYSWSDVYNMPVWLRKFTFSKIKDFYDKEAKSLKKSQSNSNNSVEVINSEGKVSAPQFLNKASYK